MRLFELQAPGLFLSSTIELAIGSVQKLDEPIDYLDAGLEAALEEERPEGFLPRRTSLVLSTQPVGARYSYLIEPLGRVERQHLGWVRTLSLVDPLQSGVRRHLAQGYWSGTECAEARAEPWEHRARAVRILARIGRSGRDV